MHGFPSASLIYSSIGGNAPLRRKSISSAIPQIRQFRKKQAQPCRVGLRRRARDVATPKGGSRGHLRAGWGQGQGREPAATGKIGAPRGRGYSGFPARGTADPRALAPRVSPRRRGQSDAPLAVPPSRPALTCVAAGTRTPPKPSRPAGWAVPCRLRARRSHLSCRPEGRSTPLAGVDPLASQMRAAAG